MTLNMGKTLLLNGTISDASLKIYHMLIAIITILNECLKLPSRQAKAIF